METGSDQKESRQSLKITTRISDNPSNILILKRSEHKMILVIPLFFTSYILWFSRVSPHLFKRF